MVLAGVVLLGTLAISMPLVFAHGGGSAKVHSCVTDASGTVRIVAPGDTCRNGETPLDWAQQYGAGSGLSLDANNIFSVIGAPWGGLTGVPAGFADGVDDTSSIASDVDCAGCVGTTDIGGLAVTNDKINDGAVNTSKLADGAITNTKVAGHAITAAAIASGAVGTDELQDGAATSQKRTANVASGQSASMTIGETFIEVASAVLTVPSGTHAVLLTGQVQLHCEPGTGGSCAGQVVRAQIVDSAAVPPQIEGFEYRATFAADHAILMIPISVLANAGFGMVGENAGIHAYSFRLATGPGGGGTVRTTGAVLTAVDHGRMP